MYLFVVETPKSAIAESASDDTLGQPHNCTATVSIRL